MVPGRSSGAPLGHIRRVMVDLPCYIIAQGACNQPSGRPEPSKVPQSRNLRSPDPHGEASDDGARARCR